MRFIIIVSMWLLCITSIVGIDQKSKIVALMEVRNEEILIGQCIVCLQPYVDGIVIIDDASTDNTPALLETLAKEYKIEKIIHRTISTRENGYESDNLQLLLDEGRKMGGTHFIFIDADEIFTANCMKQNFLRNKILSLKPGEQLCMTWIQLWRSVQYYRYDSSIWTNNYKPIIFCDDGKCSYATRFLHCSKIPNNLQGPMYTLSGYERGLMHFQFVNWQNLLIKQAWYQCLELIRHPDVSIEHINSLYGQTKDENNLSLQPAPDYWFNGYDFFCPELFSIPEQWRKKQVRQWFDHYGIEYFKKLDIWHINWFEN